jgi:hypothetical protein
MARATRMTFAASVMGAVVLFAGTPGHGATLVYEPFDYTGDQLVGQTASATSVGLTDPGAWTGPTVVNSTLSNDGVSLGGVTGYPAGLGSRYSHADADGNRSVYRDLDLSFNLASDNTMYFSFLLEKSASRFFDIRLNASSERIRIGSSSGDNLHVGLQVAAGTLIEDATADGFLSLNTTYLIAGKVVTHADSLTSDEIYVKAYAAGGDVVGTAEPTLWDVSLVSGAASNLGDNIDEIRVYAGNTSSTQQLDEFRLGTDWDSVIPVPGSLAGDINGDGFVGIADLNMVLGNWNAGTPPTTGTPSIPEPASSVLMGLAFGMMAMRRNRSSI